MILVTENQVVSGEEGLLQWVLLTKCTDPWLYGPVALLGPCSLVSINLGLAITSLDTAA